MFEKHKITKETATKMIIVLIISSILFLSLSILTENHDSRKQIGDYDGASESALCSILSEMKGVGKVNALVEYNEENIVCGVIVTAEGAGDPIVKSDIVKGVSTLYNIPVSSVMVFEKEQEVVE